MLFSANLLASTEKTQPTEHKNILKTKANTSLNKDLG